MIDLARLVRYAFAGWLPGGQRLCAACDHHVWRFMPYRSGARGMPPLMSVLDVIGSDPDHFECPRCGAHDRERHLLLYLHATHLLDAFAGRSILHFAPEKHLPRRIEAATPGRYVKADLFPQAADVMHVDLLDMPFEAGEFDVVIANHVLEHVKDVAGALAGIHRVLAPTGLAILQTPYSDVLEHTFEDGGITSPAARLQAYGQEDHVRLFGRDFIRVVETAGFASAVRHHDEVLAHIKPAIFGVNAREPFLLFRKAQPSSNDRDTVPAQQVQLPRHEDERPQVVLQR